MRTITRVAALFAALFFAPVAHAQTNAATTNGSATITAGNTFQKVLSAAVYPAGRRSLTIENNNAADNCWIAFGIGITAANATKAESILLLPGGSYTRYAPFIPSDEIEATCASNSDTLYSENRVCPRGDRARRQPGPAMIGALY
jgi:hypothetical protein